MSTLLYRRGRQPSAKQEAHPANANQVFIIGADRISTELHNINVDANAALPAPLRLDYALNGPADPQSLYTRSDRYSYAAHGRTAEVGRLDSAACVPRVDLHHPAAFQAPCNWCTACS